MVNICEQQQKQAAMKIKQKAKKISPNNEIGKSELVALTFASRPIINRFKQSFDCVLLHVVFGNMEN